MTYEANLESLAKKEIPDWFQDAKLGIFIHWGLYSVPAFAPIKYGDITNTIGDYGPVFHFAHNPYSEWYLNSLRINKDEYKEYHENTYGENFKYNDFIPIFNKEAKNWNPEEWINLFKDIGAKYIVFTTKHADGFSLWPSKVKHPIKDIYQADRDIVSELTKCARENGLKMGLYYCGGLDWSFQQEPIRDSTTLLTNIPDTQEYADYVDNQIIELIDKFKPEILWNDISYPRKAKIFEIIAHYFNSVPNGVVNDRWARYPKWFKILPNTLILKKIINSLSKSVIKKEGFQGGPPKEFSNFSTPEYRPNYNLTRYKWEATRGIGRSFGYNQMETIDHFLTVKELIHYFIDIVSKNGNLLLNVGPMADGTIPEIQKERLTGLGKWIKVNGEAIYGSRPWKRAEGITENGISLRFTRKGNFLYVFILDKLNSSRLTLLDIDLKIINSATILGYDDVKIELDNENLIVSIPFEVKESSAYVLKLQIYE
ncbi:MAG: alpha-L-fucosidase [Deltaproteobacteria bacterium]|nr:alpha-L-fucosidase [Deltaproteobacteria bacterium]